MSGIKVTPKAKMRIPLHLWFLVGTTLPALAETPTVQQVDFFREKVRPILADHCFKCHSHDADKIKGGLVVDSREGLLTGGDTEPAIVPGDAEKSLLIKAVRYVDEDLQMPPKKGEGKKLDDAKIAILVEWVNQGAVWPEEAGKSQKMTVRAKGKIMEKDRQWWSFQPIKNPTPPEVQDDGWCVNDLDRFVFEKLATAGLKPAPQASHAQLIRRAYFDLAGVPPSPESVIAFEKDNAPDAFARLVDRLLGDARYGEKWARHWLDLVRYAESDGYKADDFRPHAWRYRDYVIAAFNQDKPYDRFVQEQLAGDEIFPGDLEARTATAFLRHGIFEYNNPDLITQWSGVLDELTDVAGDVFLGMGIQCARCHDHKFDPILQKDYYRLRAFFAPVYPRDDLRLAAPESERAYYERLAVWEGKTVELRKEMAALQAPHLKALADGTLKKYPPETRGWLRKTSAERAPFEEQIVAFAGRQLAYDTANPLNRMSSEHKARYAELEKQLLEVGPKPEPAPRAYCVTDVGPQSPPTFIPKRESLGEIAPGFPSVLEEGEARIVPLLNSTGRRAALARWLTQPGNPLVARVIVNRVWQVHFGRGLVGTSSDLGSLGDPPSHPELLDWLASRFVADGWSLKKLHRLILTSATWRQSITNPDARAGQLKDPENLLLWRAGTRRLDAEQIRDAILAVTGELDPKAGGPSSDASKPRRTIYTKVLRNSSDPLLEVFDSPQNFQSVAQRNVTTTPTQSLMLINSQWTMARARVLAKRVLQQHPTGNPEALTAAYRLTYGRHPTEAELSRAEQFLSAQEATVRGRKQPVKTFPFVSEKVRLREGQGAVMTPKTPQEKLVVSQTDSLPERDFTIESYVFLRTAPDSAETSTIAARSAGDKTGWTFGVTGKKAAFKPQTLIFQINQAGKAEPIHSGFGIETGKPYYVAASVKLDPPGEEGVTFYVKDLTNDDEPLLSASFPLPSGTVDHFGGALAFGASPQEGAKDTFDGIIDDVRLSSGALEKEQLLFTKEGVAETTVGYWRFEAMSGVYKDSACHGHDLIEPIAPPKEVDAHQVAFADFCHVLLNSSEFLYVD